MKNILLAVNALTLCASGVAYAQMETPRIDQRQANQEQRIAQGMPAGS